MTEPFALTRAAVLTLHGREPDKADKPSHRSYHPVDANGFGTFFCPTTRFSHQNTLPALSLAKADMLDVQAKD
jgi:hypothetical protein